MLLRNRLIGFCMNQPRWIFIFVLLLAALAALQIPNIQIDTDPENMLSHEQPDRMFHDEVKKRFKLYDSIVVGAVNDRDENGIYNPESLRDLHRLSAAIQQMEGVVRQDLMSLDTVDNITQEGPGTIRFAWMMKQAPVTQAQADQVRAAVNRLPLLQNTLVSGDGQAAAIYVPIVAKSESYRLSQEIDAVIASLGSENRYYMAGLPVAEDTFGVEMFVQMAISAPLAGLMIFVLMWYFFRSFLLITAPMLVAMATVIITMGLLIGQGYTVHIMSSMIPIFLMPIAVVDSVHILSEFADRYKPGTDPRQALREVLGHLFTPMLYTSITSAAGFASLAFTPIPPVQIFGLHVAAGIFLAFFLTFILVPAYIVSLSPQRMARLQDHRIVDEDSGALGRWLSAAGRFSLARSKLLLLGLIAIGSLSVWGIAQIQINDNPLRWFKEDHRLRIADQVMNNHFSGTYDAFLVLEEQGVTTAKPRLIRQLQAASVAADAGFRQQLDSHIAAAEADSFQVFADNLVAAFDDAGFSASDADARRWLALLNMTEQAQAEAKYFLRPDALSYVEGLQAYLDQSADVGKTNSLVTLLKTVYRELNGGAEPAYRLPDTQAAAAQTILSFQSSHRPDDLWHMVTPDYSSTALWLQLRSGDNQDMSRVIAQVDSYFRDNPLPQGVSARWAGLSYINVVWQDEMVKGMLNSLLSAFVMVLVMMVVLFRSLPLGLLSMLPLTVTILFIYGLIGWVGKDYDMPIAVLSALTLGLSVDFAIHFLERTRAIYRRQGDWQQTVAEVCRGPARAISRNAIVVAIGFTPLLLAPLVPYITVGFFLAAIMAVSALVTLVLLPAVMNHLSDKKRLFSCPDSRPEEKQNV
ncbi:efflux RND transporter permease subunit [Marinobacterium jannaschii]|uniref:efflux RND transporter permease subunit n=1 Tax=Marinobacterium jannaschii TaxID=64970 RepID=UPI000485642A|nr:MMPL family transporter [Marinobacterium jannaschii]